MQPRRFRIALAHLPDGARFTLVVFTEGSAQAKNTRLLPFLARHLLILEGWRPAYLALGILYLAVMLPLALLVRDAPRPTTAAAAAAVTIPRCMKPI